MSENRENLYKWHWHVLANGNWVKPFNSAKLIENKLSFLHSRSLLFRAHCPTRFPQYPHFPLFENPSVALMDKQETVYHATKTDSYFDFIFPQLSVWSCQRNYYSSNDFVFDFAFFVFSNQDKQQHQFKNKMESLDWMSFEKKRSDFNTTNFNRKLPLERLPIECM